MWLNATCHQYILEVFNLQPMFIPTVVYYHPVHKKFGNLVGKFTERGIKKFQDEFKKGNYAEDFKGDEVTLQRIDCAHMLMEEELPEDSDLENEILAEILAEQEAKEKELEEEDETYK